MAEDYMTDSEFAAKVENEGLFYAFTSYGLSHRDLNPEGSEIYEEVKAFVEALEPVRSLAEELESLLEEICEEE